MVGGMKEFREKWEKNLTSVSVIETSFHNFLIVLKNRRGIYYCHRYFTVGGEWEVSVDRSGISADEALKWLEESLRLG
jgi:hypothetical protein